LEVNSLESFPAPKEGKVVGFASSSFANVELKFVTTKEAIKQYLRSLCMAKILP
jgi:hypothetical protein